MTLGLYLITRDNVTNYDSYAGAVVVATSKHDARMMHPDGGLRADDADSHAEHFGSWDLWWHSTWVPLPRVIVQRIGDASPGFQRGDVVICDYLAG